MLYGVAQRNKYDLSVRNDEIVEGEISMWELAEETWGGGHKRGAEGGEIETPGGELGGSGGAS